MSNQPRNTYPSPQTTLVILLGASHWPYDSNGFKAYAAFAHAAQKIEDYFLSIYGIPQAHIHSYFDDPRNAIEITNDINYWLGTVKSDARDLILYYIGHAKHTMKDRQLYLAIQATQSYNPEGTSLKVDNLVRAVKQYHLRYYYIFDCCFAATAIEGLQGTSEKDLLQNTLDDAEMQTQGLTALFSSGKSDASIILPDQKNTFFSEALLSILQDNSTSSDSPLTFATVYPKVKQQLRSLHSQYRFYPNVTSPPIPHLYSGNLSDVPIFPKLKPTISQKPRQQPLLKVNDIQQTTQLNNHSSGVTVLAFSPDNKTLVSGDKKGKVTIWDTSTKSSFALNYTPFLGFVFNSLIPFGLASVQSIAFHPKGKTFVVGWLDGKCKLCETQTGSILDSFAWHNEKLQALAFSSDGIVLVSSGRARKYQRHVTTGQGSYPEVSAEWSLKLQNADKNVSDDKYDNIVKLGYYDCMESTPSIAFSPKGRFFAASGSTGIIRIWDIFERKERFILKNKFASRDSFTSLAFHPDENLIAAINQDGQCLIWDIATGEFLDILEPLSGKMIAIAFSPDGYHLATSHSSGIIGFWSPDSRKLLHSFRAHAQSIPALVYSPDGYNLVSGSLDKTIRVWGN